MPDGEARVPNHEGSLTTKVAPGVETHVLENQKDGQGNCTNAVALVRTNECSTQRNERVHRKSVRVIFPWSLRRIDTKTCKKKQKRRRNDRITGMLGDQGSTS